MKADRLAPLQALRRSDEAQGLSRLKVAVTSRERAETEVERRTGEVDRARERLAQARQATGFPIDADGSPVLSGAELGGHGRFVTRLRIETGRLEQRLETFRATELARAHAEEAEARRAYRENRGDRQSLDKHADHLTEIARRRIDRRSEES